MIRLIQFSWFRDIAIPDHGYLRHQIGFTNYNGPIPRIGDVLYLPEGTPEKEIGDPDDSEWVVDRVTWELLERGWDVCVSARVPRICFPVESEEE